MCKEGHAITLIDKKPQKMQALEGLYDVLTITGNGASYNVLKEAGIEEADLIIAVTNSDELNLLCCTIATQVGNCAAIARVRTPEYSAEVEYLRGKLGLAMIINPELETAREAARILSLPTALEVIMVFLTLPDFMPMASIKSLVFLLEATKEIRSPALISKLPEGI